MKRKVLGLFVAAACVLTLTLAAVPARAGTAVNVATSWMASTTVGQNFNFGNPATTDLSDLPGQVQTSVELGGLTSYLMAALLFGF